MKMKITKIFNVLCVNVNAIKINQKDSSEDETTQRVELVRLED